MDESASERVITPMPKSLLAAIDDYRFDQRMRSRAEAIRQLIEAGLKAAAPAAKAAALKLEPTGGASRAAARKKEAAPR
jgi:metal-responsive CopG/Arc/MetJ family transcriptional regulator